MKEENAREDVEDHPERVRERSVRKLQPGQEDREAHGDHEWPEAALRAPPPGHEAGKDVRQYDPDKQGRADARVDQPVAGVCQRDGRRGHGYAGERERPQHDTAWPARVQISTLPQRHTPENRPQDHWCAVLPPRGEGASLPRVHAPHNLRTKVIQDDPVPPRASLLRRIARRLRRRAVRERG